MYWLSQPMTRVIHEAGSVILAFAYSRSALVKLRANFVGEWKFFDKVAYEISEQRANKACVEMAIFMRALDDEEDISKPITQAVRSFGTLINKDGSKKDLKLRDVSNKIIHAKGLVWDFTDSEKPKLVSVSRDTETWARAEIQVEALAAFFGMIGS